MHGSRINLSAGGLRHRTLGGEDFDPMASVANIVDTMLVFACGLMLSLIVYWNLDIGVIDQVQVEQKVTEVDNIDELAEQMLEGGNSYQELGMVYKDPTTGKLYMLTEDLGEETVPEADTQDS